MASSRRLGLERCGRTPYKQSLPPDQAAIEMVVPLAALDLLRLAPTSDTRSSVGFDGDFQIDRLSHRPRQFASPAAVDKLFGTARWPDGDDRRRSELSIKNRNYPAAMVAAEILGNIGDRRLLNSPGPMVRTVGAGRGTR